MTLVLLQFHLHVVWVSIKSLGSFRDFLIPWSSVLLLFMKFVIGEHVLRL